MARGRGLEIQGTVDELALKNGQQAQALLRSWYCELSDIAVEAHAVSSGVAVPAVGCFFSGGVDSFYSALTRLDEITHLIFVAGFDIELSNESLTDRAVAAARGAAKALGKEFIEVRTNLRELGEDVLDWGTQYHGAALAAVGLALANVLGKVIILSSYHREELFPWGSHPELDYLWSSSRVVFEHDGVDVTRPQKVAEIARHQVALDHLRVCWENRDNEFNCGRCEKCLRTMVNLRSVGALARCRTLPTALRASDVRHLRLSRGGVLFAQQNLAQLRELSNRDRRLERALRQAVFMHRVRAPMARVKARLVAAVRR